MKRRLLSLFTILLIFFSIKPSESKASHAAGGEIIYEWIQDSTYRVFFKFYRDCGGIDKPGAQTLCYYSSCNPSQTFNANMTMWPGQIPPGVDNGTPVTLGCSGSTTECTPPPNTNNNIPGVEEWWYYAIVELPYRCNFWTFSTSISARNSSKNIPQTDFYVETTYNNQYGQGIGPTGQPYGNSSPYFDQKPIPYTCLDLPYSFNNQAVDPNGDSLVTELIAPLDGGNCGPGAPLTPTGKTPPLNFTNNPFQSATLAAPTGSFVLNAQTGQMNFTATEDGAQTLAIRVKEYRNGVLLGSIIRDVQLQVLLPNICNYTPSTITPGVTIDSAIFTGGQVQGCENQQMQFCFDLATADPVGVLFVRDNSPTANQLAGMQVTYTGQGGRNVRGCAKWRPTAGQLGLRNLIITVKDSTCHPPGIVFTQSFTIPIFVNSAVKAFKDTSLCPGDKIVLNAQGGGNYEWSEIGGGSLSSLSCTICPNPTATPFGTIKYAVTSTATTFCKNNKDTIDVTMLPTPIFDKQGDFTVCPGNSVNYDLNVQTPPGETTTVTWTPTTYLNAPSIQNPVSSPLNDAVYYIEIKNSGNRCRAFDTSKIEVLDGFAIETPDTAICLGAAVEIRAIGDPGYTYNWVAETQAIGVISDPAILTPTITPGEARVIVYKLTASRPGCKDSVARITIDAQPNPIVVVNDDFSICYGDTLRLSSMITPAYDRYSLDWTPGAMLDNSNAKNPVFSALEDVTLQLEVSTPAGCKGTDEVKIEVLPADFLVLTEDDAICPGETAEIKVTGTNVAKMWWDENSPYMDDRMSWNPKVSPVVTHTYKVYGIDNNRCRDTQEVTITVKPAAVVSLPDTMKLYPGEEFRMSPKGNALYYSWFPHVGLSRADVSDPIVRPSVNTRYFVTATTEAGCRTTDSVDVLVQTDSYVEIPNVFAPGRGVNGVFKVLRMGEATLTKFTVYNRWGVKMFETSDINEGWDGRYNSQSQPMGVYMYTVQGKTAAGTPFNKQGNVTLLR